MKKAFDRTRRCVVVGLGNFGASAAIALHQHGHDVVVLDTEESAVDRIAAKVDRAAVGDGRERSVLERIGAADADIGIVSTGDDITASILTTLALRDLGVQEVYAKVVSDEHARVMEKLGITETIFPERESAIRLGTRLSNQVILDYVRIGTDFGIQEMAVPDAWIGKTLRELHLPRRYGISVIAVHDVLTDEMRAVPDPDARLKDSDTLVIAGSHDDLVRVAKAR